MITTLMHLVRKYILWVPIDALIVATSLILAWATRSITADLDIRPALFFGLAAIGVCCAVNYLFRLYHRIWRYASAGEIVVIGAAVGTSTAILTLVDLLWPQRRPVPLSVVLMTGFFAFVGFVSVRYRRRVWTGLQWRWRAIRGHLPRTRTRTLIHGAGEAGQLLAWRFQNQKEGEDYELIGFVDDDPAKQGMRVHGIRILGDRHTIPDVVARHRVDLIVIAIYNISGQDFRDIVAICEETSAQIKVLPNIFDFIGNTKKVVPICNVTAEDLLRRKPVEIDRQACRTLLADKVVLVTGAAGSIGSELSRQILAYAPRHLLMLDNNETGLHDLVTTDLYRFADIGNQKEILADPRQCVVPIIGDVTNKNKVETIFEVHRPEIVFHAAAYKHVPLMEEHPDEAVRVNILGMKIVAELATHHGAERFVFVSTDKAVDPCSIMGATKRLGEFLIANCRSHIAGNECLGSEKRPQTLFTAVRFGNVLGSRGSVVPAFERQIEMGGPVTVTHPEMTRYFMSVNEAASLIIQAAALTRGGDVFILDMGQQISIDDLARRLMRLRGLRPEVDIRIIYTGVRPGEKIHEELFGRDEKRYPTMHPKILRIENNLAIDEGLLFREIEELIALAEDCENSKLREKLWQVVGMLSGKEVESSQG